MVWESRLESTWYSHISDVEFLPDGRTFIVASGITVALYDSSNGRQIDIFRKSGFYTDGIDISADGKQLLVCTWKSQNSGPPPIEIWDIGSKEKIRELNGHSIDIYDAAFSLDGKMIVSSSRDGSARLWDTMTGREIRSHKTQGWGLNAGWSPDGRDYFFGDGKGTHIIDVTTGTEKFLLQRSTYGWSLAQYTSDSRYIVTYLKGKFRLSDANTGNPVAEGGLLDARSFDLTPDGKFIVSGSSLESISVTKISGLELVFTSLIGQDNEVLTWICPCVMLTSAT